MSAQKQRQRQRHVPIRVCVGCRQSVEKKNSMRIVRGEQRVQIDPTGKAAGRGAYLHTQRSCWEKGLKGSLARALRVELSVATLEELNAYLENLID